VVRVTVEGMEQFSILTGCFAVQGSLRDSVLNGMTFKIFNQVESQCSGYILQGTNVVGKFYGAITGNGVIAWTMYIENIMPGLQLFFRGAVSIDAMLFKGSIFAAPDTLKPIGILSGKKTGCDTIMPPPAPVSHCSDLDTIAIQDCSVDLKAYAAGYCKEQGMTGTLVNMIQPCDPIKKTPAFIVVQCCSTATSAPVSCFADTMGGPTSCKDTLTWTRYAQAECSAQGLVLKGIRFEDPCAPGRYSTTVYEACKPNP
jgi:hypothetical protein